MIGPVLLIGALVLAGLATLAGTAGGVHADQRLVELGHRAVFALAGVLLSRVKESAQSGVLKVV